MIRVRRIAHASFETPDIERQVAYYTEILGLTLVAKDDDAAYLASTLDHHSVVLRYGIEPRCTRIAFQLAPDADLDAFEHQVAEHGIKTARKSDPEPSIPAVISFTDPKGTVMEVFREREFSGQRYQSQGVVPHRLGHVAFHVEDVQKAAKFYRDVLGFRDSDWMADFFAFLRCGPDHHTINLVETGKVKLHHLAFEVRDWSHLQTACDFLRARSSSYLPSSTRCMTRISATSSRGPGTATGHSDLRFGQRIPPRQTCGASGRPRR
jgi:catechol 2,3-dioxygenase-like lactoylglutathione lyase family enzyme